MENYKDLLEDSTLHLLEIQKEPQQKTYILRWIVNDFKSLPEGRDYGSHFIKVRDVLCRLFFRRHAIIKRDTISSRMTYILIGLMPKADFNVSFFLVNLNKEESFDSALSQGIGGNFKEFFVFSERWIVSKDKLVLLVKLVLPVIDSDDMDILFPLKEIDTYSHVARDIGFLFHSERFCDTTVLVGEKEFRVHRAILGARSSVFAAMLEMDMREKAENKLVIEDTDSDTFSEILRYIYSGKTSPLTMNMALELLPLADKYDLPQLKSDTAYFLSANLTVDHVLRTLVLADMHRELKLKSEAAQYVADNLLAAMKRPEWIEFRNRLELVDCILEILGKKSLN